GFSAGLLDDKCQGIRLVEQTELSLRVFLRSGIEVDAAFKQVSVKVSNQASDVAGLEFSLLAAFHKGPYAPLPIKFESFVDRIDEAGPGRLDIRMRKEKLPQARLVGEAVGPAAGSVNQHRRRSI